jgi:tripartite-type tricarboxylate transporter receptor subunit TctC
MKRVRRVLCTAITSCVMSFALVSASYSEKFPEKPIKIIVPWPPGGAGDVSARMISKKMSDLLKVPVVIENLPGAGGITGMTAVWRAKPDGYTIALNYLEIQVMAEILNRNVPFKTRKFSLVGTYATAVFGIAVDSHSNFNTFNDFLHANRVLRACVTNGNDTGALAAKFLKSKMGLKLALVTGYGGAAPQILGVLKGECDFVTLGAVLKNYVQSGRLKVILTLAERRSPWFPDSQSLTEAHVPQELATLGGLTYVLWAPPGTPENRLAVIRKAVFKSVAANSDALKKMQLDVTPLDNKQTTAVVDKFFTAAGAFLER